MRGHLCKDLKDIMAGKTMNLEGISRTKPDLIYSKHSLVTIKADKPSSKHGNNRRWLVGGRGFQSDPDSLMITMQCNTCLIWLILQTHFPLFVCSQDHYAPYSSLLYFHYPLGIKTSWKMWPDCALKYENGVIFITHLRLTKLHFLIKWNFKMCKVGGI